MIEATLQLLTFVKWTKLELDVKNSKRFSPNHCTEFYSSLNYLSSGI